MRRAAFLRRMAFAAIASGMLGSELLWRRQENETRHDVYAKALLVAVATNIGISYDDLVRDYQRGEFNAARHKAIENH